jgi:hypothetical protein
VSVAGGATWLSAEPQVIAAGFSTTTATGQHCPGMAEAPIPDTMDLQELLERLKRGHDPLIEERILNVYQLVWTRDGLLNLASLTGAF